MIRRRIIRTVLSSVAVHSHEHSCMNSFTAVHTAVCWFRFIFRFIFFLLFCVHFLLYIMTCINKDLNATAAVVLCNSFSRRQHLSYDVCLEVRVEIIRTVLCCIVY